MTTNTTGQESAPGTGSAGISALKNTVVMNAVDSTTDKRQGDTPSAIKKPEVAKKEQDTTSTSDLLLFIKSQQEKPALISRTTSTPDGFPCGCPETVFYHIHQEIGTKSRYTEFKQGSMVWDSDVLIKTIGENVCGFLNSEGGTVFLGVADSGLVVGISINEWQMKDIREDIEYAIQSIKPEVDPGEYSINFARVMEDSGGFSKNLKVVEVCVKPRKPPENFYRFHKVIYVRRDRSVQKIVPSHNTNVQL